MKLKLDYSNIKTDAVGDGGIELPDAKALAASASNVIDNKGRGGMSWTQLPFVEEDYIDEIIEFTRPIRKKARCFVVLGIGGSALGTKAIAHALLNLNHNQLTVKQRERAPRLYVEDNIDPERMQAMFDAIDIKSSYFNFITKSGETCETLCQFLIIYDILKNAIGIKNARKRIIITTTHGQGALYDVAVKEGFKIFTVPKDVGGRFSVFSAVGLVPLCAIGIDIKMLLKGAADMDASCSNTDVYQNPALLSAYLHHTALKNGRGISVMMPYGEALRYICDFYCQLIGESLGKQYDNDGRLVNTGITPVKAIGVTDQHSQIQLYTHGPDDKLITFVAVEQMRDEIIIPDDRSIQDFAYLKGKTLNEIFNKEYRATAYALTKANRPNISIVLPYIGAYTVGELLTYFMYQTAFLGELLSINTFDQPGVEGGKLAAYSMVGRSGFSPIEQTLGRHVIGGED